MSSNAKHDEHAFTNRIVRIFLESRLSIILILLATLVGIAALIITPREEDPQIVVPLADVFVQFPGHSAKEVEQLVATPLEKMLYQIDGVEYVYSMSQRDQAVITVRYYVGEDREKSLVKLYKKIDENVDVIPPGVTGWVVKPVEIDDVPIVTLTLTSPTASDMMLRRVGEELTERLAAVKNVSRAYVVGGRPRTVHVYMDPDRMQAHHITPLQIQQAIQAANVTQTAGDFKTHDNVVQIEAGKSLVRPGELDSLVVGVDGESPVLLKNVADVVDGPAEVTNFVRHTWGPAAAQNTEAQAEEGFPSTVIGDEAALKPHGAAAISTPAVTIAIAKKKGTNAVWVAQDVLKKAAELQRDIVPADMQLIVTRNYGLTADDKVNELVEGLGVAILIVIALLTLSLGWREAIIVAVAVPVVFGLTLFVNLLFGFTINRVTLFALILALGLLVDDPIVDVENIARHFALHKRASRKIVMEAVSEIRPPLITATLAVIVSFLPMFFITGMMGPYMRPMALNVPVTMLMSMLVAFTITPWLAYQMLKGHANKQAAKAKAAAAGGKAAESADPHDLGDLHNTALYKMFRPLMSPLLKHGWAAWTFLGLIGILTVGAMYLAADRSVPLKMLPFDNKNELLLVLDTDRGTTLERTDALVRDMESYLKGVPEVTDVTSYVGVASPMDFNGLVRHYYLRQGDNVAEVRIDLAAKKERAQQSHAIALRLRNDLTAIAQRHHARLKIVETPPGPPVIASVVAEVTGQPDNSYQDLLNAAATVRERLKKEPGVVDVDDVHQAPETKLTFVVDKEKAALNGVSSQQIAQTLSAALGGANVGTLHDATERNPLRIDLRLPVAKRSSPDDLAQLVVMGHAPDGSGQMVSLAELGHWEDGTADQMIYHKNLQPIAYVFAETAGRPPADVVVDVEHDRQKLSAAGAAASEHVGSGWIGTNTPRPVSGRTFFANGSGVDWAVPAGINVNFSGEGEWNITLDVFRDLGLAFAAALVGIYILLVAQTGSFLIPVVVMLAIPLTVLGVMPGFWVLNHVIGTTVGGYADPVFFTATAMIGMIALAGIVTRNSIILIDFIHLSLARGKSLYDAIIESCVVRMRPILLTAGAAMLGAVPIIIDPIFSGLAWSLIFGLFASTLFTLFVIPVAYYIIYRNTPGHGVQTSAIDAEELAAARDLEPAEKVTVALK